MRSSQYYNDGCNISAHSLVFDSMVKEIACLQEDFAAKPSARHKHMPWLQAHTHALAPACRAMQYALRSARHAHAHAHAQEVCILACLLMMNI